MPRPPDPPDPRSLGARLERLVDIMRILRSPDGCPWDREQTLQSLRPFVLEEAYEVVEAIDAGDLAALRDELGDFVFEAVFLALVGEEAGGFSLRDSLDAVADKLIRRHPHVFAEPDPAVKTPDDVKRRWEAIKADERKAVGRAGGLLSGLPTALPGLLRAYRMGRRAATVGFDWSDVDGVIAKVHEELAELGTAAATGSPDEIEDEVGDLLFTVANLARHLGVEPEGALRRANTKFFRRFTRLEHHFEGQARPIREVSASELDAEWQRIKSEE